MDVVGRSRDTDLELALHDDLLGIGERWVRAWNLFRDYILVIDAARMQVGIRETIILGASVRPNNYR